MIGKIITSPFRALGALLGGGSGEQYESLAFAPGTADLAPSEREKLTQIATMLQSRPGLGLSLAGVYADADRSSLQDLQLRRAVALRAGQVLAEGEDPGPISTRAPRIHAALEALFSERLGGAALAALKASYPHADAAGAPAPAATAGDSATSADSGAAAAAMQRDAYDAALLAQLRTGSSVDEAQLVALATRRAANVAAALTAAGVPAGRLQSAASGKVEANGQQIDFKITPVTAAKS